MQKSSECWECSNRGCGQKIQFLMLDGVPNRADPTCFCGSSMKHAYLKPDFKPDFAKYESTLLTENGAARPSRVSVRIAVLRLDAVTCLLPGPDA